MSTAKTKCYKQLSAHLMSVLGGDDITVTDGDNDVILPRLKWVDKNRGQIQHLTTELVIPMPAILIAFPGTDYEYQGAGSQKGMAIVRITMLFESYADTFHGSVNQDTALEYLLYCDAVYECLENFYGDNFSALKRIREEEEEDHDFLIITHMDFLTEFTDTKERILNLTGNANPVRQINKPTNPTDERPGQFIFPE